MRRVTHLLAALAAVTLIAALWSRPQSLDGHRLVGVWQTEPGAFGPYALTFGGD